VTFDFNSRIIGGRMFTNGGERVDGEDSTRMTLEPFPKPSWWVRFINYFKEAAAARKRQRWLRHRRASIPDPFTPN
jgi:hypothetical protein